MAAWGSNQGTSKFPASHVMHCAWMNEALKAPSLWRDHFVWCRESASAYSRNMLMAV